jgi:hypothetical protein
VDLGLRQRLFSNKGTLSIGCRDVFDTQRFEVNAFANTFYQRGAFKRQTRVATINFTYRFGKQINNEKRKVSRPTDAPQEGGGMDF